MNIVILDGYCLNPGDLSWQGFEELGLCKIYDRTRPEEVLERAKGAEILITNKTVLDADIMDNLPSLRYIGVLATGYNVVDIQAAARHGITVTNIPAYSTDSVAQISSTSCMISRTTRNRIGEVYGKRKGTSVIGIPRWWNWPASESALLEWAISDGRW